MLKSFQVTRRESRTIPLYLRVIAIDYPQEPVRRPRGIGMAQWFFCTKGEGELTINSQRTVIKSGDAFFIAAHTAHSYQALSEEWIVQILGFGGRSVPGILNCLGMSESGVYQLADPNGFCKSLLYLDHLTQIRQPHEKLVYSAEVYRILLTLSIGLSQAASRSAAGSSSLIDELILYMENHFGEDISLEELAEISGRTPEYLCSVFKKETGQTIVGFLTNLRISQARVLLVRYPEKAAGEIGKMCGFQDPSYFGKIFRKVMGMTPGEYRRSNLLL